jgi:FlaA1/EpsC-like NDP-sugar epimerase
MILEGKRVLVTGGTGSLGRVLIRRLLRGEVGTPEQIVVFSRDEAKQHYMRLEYQNRKVATDDFVYRNFDALVTFRLGDVRDVVSVASAVEGVDVVFHTAALKQVPTCEYFPDQAARTNIEGAINLIGALRQRRTPAEAAVCVSTDKACQPVNVMGMTKAIQERVFIRANLDCPATRFIGVRYGNVLASRGSIIPLFHEQIRQGGPVTVTTEEMTRFMLSLNRAVDAIFEVLRNGAAGEIFVPRVRSMRILDLARELIGDRDVELRLSGVRPGEKVHELLISEEEAHRTRAAGEGHYAISPLLPELLRGREPVVRCLEGPYSSADHLMSQEEIREMLAEYRLRVEDRLDLERDLLA